MINVDISNIWCTVSLPDLLQSEKTVFDAHMSLSGESRQNAWLSWLDPSDSARRTWVNPVITAAERIRSNSETLVVVGGGLSAIAAKAAVRAATEKGPALPVLYIGSDYSTERWLRLAQMLENRDFSVLVTPSGVCDTVSLVALRGLRWIMEKRYGDEAKNRVYVAAGSRSMLSRMAETFGYTLLPMPESPGAESSSLNSAALLIMALGGLRPGALFSGAAEMARQADDRSFDNPVWLYAAARMILQQNAMHCETVCTPNQQTADLGHWWCQSMTAATVKDGAGLFLQHMNLPEDFFLMGDSLLQPGRFATLLQIPFTTKKVSVEMDWTDLDGLNCLAGQELRTLEQKTLESVAEACTEEEIPYITVECQQPLGDETLGELLYFLEFSAGLSAQTGGVLPASHRQAAQVIEALDQNLGRKLHTL